MRLFWLYQAGCPHVLSSVESDSTCTLQERPYDFATRSVEPVFLVCSFQHSSSCAIFLLPCLSSLGLPSLSKAYHGITSTRNRKQRLSSYCILNVGTRHTIVAKNDSACPEVYLDWLGKSVTSAEKAQVQSDTPFGCLRRPRRVSLDRALESWEELVSLTLGFFV